MPEQASAPHDVIGKKIFDLCVREGLIQNVGPDVIICGILGALQNFSSNANAESFAIHSMGQTARILADLRDAKIERPHASIH